MPKSRQNRNQHNKSHKRLQRGGKPFNSAISPIFTPSSGSSMSPPATAPYSRSPKSLQTTAPLTNKSLLKPKRAYYPTQKPMSSSQKDFKGTMAKHATTALNAVKGLFRGGKSRRPKRRSKKRHTRKGKKSKSHKRRKNKHVRR